MISKHYFVEATQVKEDTPPFYNYLFDWDYYLFDWDYYLFVFSSIFGYSHTMIPHFWHFYLHFGFFCYLFDLYF